MDKQLSQQISDLKSQLAVISQVIDRIDQKVQEPEPVIPEWVKMAADDSVPLHKVMEAARIWDQEDFESWSQNWNKTKHKRIGLLKAALETWQSDVLSRKPPTFKVQLNSVEAAERVVNQLREFQLFHSQLGSYVQGYDKSMLNTLCQQDSFTDFRKYYDWVNQLLQDVEQLHEQTRDENGTRELHGSCTHVLSQLLNQIDSDMIPSKLWINAETFEPQEVPFEDQVKYKEREMQVYKQNLHSAFEYLRRTMRS